jgi:hypothetical protein
MPAGELSGSGMPQPDPVTGPPIAENPEFRTSDDESAQIAFS